MTLFKVCFFFALQGRDITIQRMSCFYAAGQFQEVCTVVYQKRHTLDAQGQSIQSCVQSVVVYASETWAVRAEEEQRMERNEHVILRWMCGVTLIFDKDLSAKKQISSVCKSLYFQIRQLRQVCSSLDKNSVIVLANSLVSSKLDYCSLQLPLIIFRQFPSSYNLPAVFLDRLQKVQNALARVVVPSVRRHHHITPTLKTAMTK